MESDAKHASGKTDFELVEAAIDVAVDEADLHDDEDCPQDGTCECEDAQIVNDGHRALVRMDRKIDSLREQVREQADELLRLRSDLAGKNAGAVMIVTPEEWDALHEQVRALTADNAVLRNAMEEACLMWAQGKEISAIFAALGMMAKREVLGSALLAEMEGLRTDASNTVSSRDDAWAAAEELRSRAAELEGTLATEEAERVRCRNGWVQAQNERDEAQRRYAVEAKDNDSLRSRVAELEQRQIEDAGRIADREAIAREALEQRAKAESERDAAQRRVAELEQDHNLACMAADELRVRVETLEAHRDDVALGVGEALTALGHIPGEDLIDTAKRVRKERDADQQRAKALEQAQALLTKEEAP